MRQRTKSRLRVRFPLALPRRATDAPALREPFTPVGLRNQCKACPMPMLQAIGFNGCIVSPGYASTARQPCHRCNAQQSRPIRQAAGKADDLPRANPNVDFRPTALFPTQASRGSSFPPARLTALPRPCHTCAASKSTVWVHTRVTNARSCSTRSIVGLAEAIRSSSCIRLKTSM